MATVEQQVERDMKRMKQMGFSEPQIARFLYKEASIDFILATKNCLALGVSKDELKELTADLYDEI